MELELGLKITKTRDDITSISEYQLVKDRIGPVFQSRETNTMFILTAHLKGYRRNNIDIKISEDGSKISISGEKPIQEMLMMGWIMLKKDVEITRFNRVFKIPDGVILDWIKAKYDEEEWILKIVMPKSVKGICGARIEEVKEEEHDRVRSDLEKSEADHILNNVGETSQKGSEESEVQQMKDGESVMKEEGLSEKMLEDANVDRVKDTIKTKTEESNLGIDGNGKGAREKVDKVEYEVMKTSDLEQNVGASIPQNTGDTSKDKESEIQEMEDSEGFMEKNDQRVSDKVLNDANGGIIGEKIQKEIKDGNGVSLREKGAKAAAVYGAMKTPEIEQKVGAGIPQNIGDASHDNEYEVQEMVDNGTYGSSVEEKEKMVSDKMLDNANGNMIGEMIKKEIEESKLGMEGGDGESVRENDRKAACEAMKKSELEQKVGAGIPQNIGDTSHSKESEVVEMKDNATYGSNVEEKEKMVSDKMLDNANGKIIGDTIKKQIEESKLRIEGGDGASVREKDKKAGCEAMKTLEPEQNVRAHIPQSIGDTSQEFSRESVVQQMQEAESAVEKVDRQETGKMLAKANGFSQEDTHGESKQKEFAESKSETEDIHKENVEEVISMERFEETKTSELDQNVADDQIPSKVGGIDQEESKECRIQYQEESKECAIQQTEKTESVEGNMNGSESERMPFEANNAIQVNIFQETIQKDNKTPEVETVHEHEECEREKAGKEGFEAITTVKEDFHKQLPKAPQEVSKGLNVSKMKESNEAKEAMAKRKGKEIESFVEKGEGKEPKVVHAEAKTLAQKDIQIGEKLPDGSKGLMDAKMEEPKEAIWEAMAEGEKLMENVEGETSKKRTEKAGRDIKKRTLSETLQKEDEEPDIERKAKDESYVPDIIVKGVFDVMGTIQVKVPKKVAEAMALDENDKTEHSTVTLKGEGSIRMNFEANKVIEEDKTRDRTEKEIREPKLKSRDQLSMQENIDREAVDGSKRQEFPEVGETEDVKEEAVRIEQSVKEVNREKYEKIEVEVHEGFRKDITREAIQKEISDPKIQTKERDQCLQEKMGKGRFKASKAAKEEFPMEMVDSPATEKEQLKDTRIGEAKEELVKQKSEEKMGKTEDTEDDAKIEQSVKKVKGEKYEKIQVETNGDKRKDITRETTQKETREPEIQSKEKDQQCLQEEMSKGRLEVSKAAQEEFLVKTIDSLANKREGLKDTMPEKAKEVKEELGKQHSEEKKEEIEDVKDKGVAIEQLVKKDITRKTTQKETKQPKIQTEEKDQQCLQDATSKGRLEASTTAREFPLQMIDSLSKRRVESKDKKIEETEKVKQEVSKRKTKETKVVESTTEEKIQESDSKRITKILQEVQKEKHPKALEIGTNERELQPKTSLTTDAKVVSMGFKEVEQVSAKKQKTELLSPIVRSKDTLESRKESVDQGTIKSKKAKEAEKGAQYTYNIESTKAVATIEDQVAKPRFQSTQQFEAEEGKLQEGCKEKYEPSPKSQKEYHTKDLQHSVEMKDQESKHMEMLKPEVPSEELRKKSEQDTRKDEFQKGEKIEKTMQEDIEQPKDKIDDRDQQYVQQDVGKEVGAVEIIRREMPKEEYVSNAGPTAGRMETKTDLEATLERQKYITQNVNDEKLGIKEEIKRNNFEKMDKVKFTAELMKTTQVKEHQRKSEAVEKEAEPLEAKSSLPSLTSIGVKDMGPELHHKDLSPLTLTEETKSKEPLKLEQPNMECKLPKTKEHVPESRDRKRYGYGIEDIEAPKITAYKGAKPSKLQSSTLTQQSIDEENRTPENVVDELPKENTDTDFQKSIESVTPTENEYNETFQARILENQGLEDNQEVYGQEAAPSECGYQERNQEGIKCPRISTGDRGRQYVQKDHDKKGYQTTKAVDEELLKQQYRAEKIVLEEREVPKVAKSGETKEASKQLHIREKGKTTQTAEDKKPKMKEITPEFEKVNEFKQIEEGMREPPTKIEKIPKKGMEESQREEMSPLPTEIQRKEPHELSWPSIATQQSQVKEEDITDESHKVEKQESKKEDSNATVQDSNRSKADQEVEQIETQQPECHKDQIFINKDEEQSQLIHDTEEGKNNELQVEEEGEVVEVEQQKEYEEEEASGQNKNKTKRTKKLFVPLFVAGSALLVSLVFIFAHRIRARKRSS